MKKLKAIKNRLRNNLWMRRHPGLREKIRDIRLRIQRMPARWTAQREAVIQALRALELSQNQENVYYIHSLYQKLSTLQGSKELLVYLKAVFYYMDKAGIR